MLGVPGTMSLDEVIQLYQETHALGLIVFSRNFKSAALFKSWLSSLESALDRKLLVAVDHEGGRVIHLSEEVTFFADNLTLGWTGSEDYAFRQGVLEAGQLRGLGIDLNLAPTLDVLTAHYSPNIGIRSYGKDPGLVARLGAARIKGMQVSGLSACAKHFPGQGQSSLDAHLDLPVLMTSPDEYDSIHSVPFKSAIQAGVAAVMTSHPVYPALGGLQSDPATFSNAIVTGLLREKLGFRGVILSDDLEMGALKNYGTVGEAALRAVLAGHDMVLICSDPLAAREAAGQLREAYQGHLLSDQFIEESQERLRVLQDQRQQRFEAPASGYVKEGALLAERIACEGLSKSRSAQEIQMELSPDQTLNSVVIYPKLSVLSEKIAFEAEMQNDGAFIESVLKKAGISAQAVLLSLDPGEIELKTVLKTVEDSPEVLFFCFDPHLYEGCRRMLRELEEKAANLKVIFLRDPFGADLLERPTPSMNAFGFRAVQIRAAVRILADCRLKNNV